MTEDGNEVTPVSVPVEDSTRGSSSAINRGVSRTGQAPTAAPAADAKSKKCCGGKKKKAPRVPTADGRDPEPVRGYFLTYVVAMGCILIGDLNAIAPLISNFFMISYALTNYACFATSMTKVGKSLIKIAMGVLWFPLLFCLFVVSHVVSVCTKRASCVCVYCSSISRYEVVHVVF